MRRSMFFQVTPENDFAGHSFASALLHAAFDYSYLSESLLLILFKGNEQECRNALSGRSTPSC